MTILGNAAGTENKDAPKDGGAAGAGAGGTETDPAKIEAAKVAAAAAETAKKAESEAAAKPFADVKQLKLPDGAKLDEAQMKDFLPVAQKLGLTAAQAQGLVELSLKQNAAIEKQVADSHAAATEKAISTLKSDKEIGGSKWAESMKHVETAKKAFGGDGLNEALESVQLADGTMLGDSLVMARLLVRIGKASAEDSISKGTKPASGAGEFVPKNLFPKTPQLT